MSYIDAKRILTCTAVIPLFVACSALKLDKEANCLNEKSACFKFDTTRPSFKSSTPAVGQTVSTLDYVDMTFTEELKNPQPADFNLQSPGNALSIARVEKLTGFTYRLWISGAVQNGSIIFSFDQLHDYNGNYASGSLTITGNVDIGITFDTNLATNPLYREGVSSAGGTSYSATTIRFKHDFQGDVANANDWKVYRTTGITACSGPGVTLLGGIGAATLAGETYVSFTLNEATHFPVSEGYYRIVVCINNAAKNKFGAQGILIARDNSAPALTIDPYSTSDEYRTSQSVVVSCSDNATKIAYRQTSFNTWTGNLTDPADPADPDFTSAGAVDTGGGSVEYSGSVTTPGPAFLGDPNNPVRSKYKFRCIDKAGNKSAVTAGTSPIYVVDNTLPEVTISLTGTFRDFITSTIPANNSTTISFTTNQPAGQTYKINKNGSSCDAGGTDMVSALTPAAGTLISHTFSVGAAANQFAIGVHNLRICVRNPANTKWGVATLTVTRDDTAPVVTTSVASGTYGSLQSVALTCSDNKDKLYVTSAEGLGAAVPTAPPDPVLAAQEESSGSLSPANDRTTIYKWICRDKAGQVSAVGTAQYTIDTVIPAVTIVSNQYPAVSSVVGAFQSTNLAFHSSRGGLTYRIMRGTTDCVTGATQIGTDQTVPAAVSGVVPDVTVNLGFAGFPTSGTTYDLRVCVYNNAGSVGYNTTTLQITRDDTNPAIPSPTPSIAQVNATNFTLTWTAATDTGGSGIAGYRIFRSLTSGLYGASPDYTASSSPATLAMPDTQTYFLRIVPFDAAGNTPAGPYTEISTKPTITVVVSGLTGGSFTFSDGMVANTISANTAGSIWTTTLGIGATHNFNVTTQPAGQVCSIKEKQFGTLNANLTININCVTGQMVAGRFQALAPAGMNNLLYRTKADVWSSLSTDANSMVIAGSNIYFGGYDCDAGAPVAPCIYQLPLAGFTSTPVVSNLPAAARGIATDGTNLYYTTLSPDNRLYKYPLSGGTPIEIASGLNNPFGVAVEGGYAYVCNRNAGEIVRIDLATGGSATLVTGIAGGPLGMTLTSTHIYFTSGGTHAIYRAPKAGGSATVVYGSSGSGDFRDDSGVAARFNEPHDLLYDGSDNIFVTEYQGHRVRRIRLSTNRVTTLVGHGLAALYTNGTGAAAHIANPVGIGTDGRNLFISLHGTDKRIVKLSDAGLIGYWPLGNTSDDYSSDAAAVTPAWTGAASFAAGRYAEINGAAAFDGTKYITTKNINIVVNQPFTLAAWVKVSDLTAARPILGNLSNYEFQFYIGNNGSVNFQNWYSAGALSNYLAGTAAGVVTANAWVHVAYVYRGSNTLHPGGRIFVNGHDMTAASTQASAGSLDSYASNVAIGATLSHASRFVGSMADVRIYSRALNEGEINELAQDAGGTAQVGSSYNKRATELIAFYEMGDYAPSGSFAETMLGGVSSATGKDGETTGARAFDGSGSLSVTQNLEALPIGNAPRTMCAFIRPTAYPALSDYNSPVSYGTTGSLKEFGLALSRDAGTSFFVSNTFNSVVDHSVNFKVPLYTWTHLCASYDGTDSRLYVDGVLVGTKTVAIATALSLGAFRVGAWFSDTHRFTGQVDDVRVYNKALTQFEIRQIAGQVPSGLVARYDFSGDRDDVSGFGQDLSNNGVNLTNDRYAVANAAAGFSGSAYFETTMNGFSTGNAARSVCAWARPTALSASFSRVVMYGTVASSFGLGMDNSRFFTLDGAGDVIFVQPPPLNVWRHLCVVHSGSIERLYLDGYVVGSPGRTLATGSGGVLRIGRAIDITDYFTGAIDEVRVYNRAISQSEVQALVQQPNKRIQLSGPTVQGDMGGSPSGIVGADQRCPSGFKAMIVDGSQRRACTSTNCGTSGLAEHVDWVLRPNVTYVQSPAILPVFTADWNGVWNFSGTAPTGGGFFNFIFSGSQAAWTGLASDWQVANAGLDLDCSDWGSILSSGAYGRTNGTGSNAIFQSTALCTDGTSYLYCVEQ